MAYSIIEKKKVFRGYEDAFPGELAIGEGVVPFEVDGEDAYRVHPIRDG